LVKNLYFTGHWTQPGGGITPVIVSEMQVAGRITKGKEARAGASKSLASVDGQREFGWARYPGREGEPALQ